MSRLKYYVSEPCSTSFFRQLPTFGVTVYWFFSVWVVVLHDVSMVWSVCVYSSYYSSDGLNFWCILGAILWGLCLSFSFSATLSSYNPLTSFVLTSLSTIVSASVYIQLVRILWSGVSYRLGASFLKTEAEPGSETKCFSVYISVTLRTK